MIWANGILPLKTLRVHYKGLEVSSYRRRLTPSSICSITFFKQKNDLFTNHDAEVLYKNNIMTNAICKLI